MSMPAISVAMSAYNGERFLAEAMDSVLAQSFADFELLVVDDGSTDSTPDILRAYAARDSRVRPIIRENRGLIASLNQLIEEARAPLIARMDADDICMADRFERQVDFLGEHPEYGAVGSAAEDIDEFGKPYAAPDHPPPLTHAEVLRTIERRPPLCHPSVMARSAVLRGAGGYHRAFRHCEDYDLWLRLANSTAIGNLPEKLLRYRRYENQISSRHSYEQQYGAAVAVLAYRERLAGRPDPTAQLAALPPLDAIDQLFGRPVAGDIRSKMARGLLYSRSALAGEGFDLLLRHIRDGGRGFELWRTVARLLRFGEPVRAARLAAALAGV